MHRVVALARPVQSTFELGCAAEVFGLRRNGIARRYEFEVCTETPGPVPTTGGFVMHVAQGLSALDTADTIVIPGWLPVGAPLPDAVRDALLRAHARGARLAAICSGVFALARTGLLDGRSVTTHFARAARLRREFPGLRVEPEHAYIDHGDVATSAGAGAGLELCLHLVRRDHGPDHAALLARHMALPQADEPSPSTGEAGGLENVSQFDSILWFDRGAQLDSAPPSQDSANSANSLASLLTWATERLADPLSVADLAAHLGVSPRTLARRFTEQLGTSPGAWLLSRRVAAARALLEQTDLPVEAIAARVGLASAVNLRRRFRVHVGTSPGAYRRASRNSPPAPTPAATFSAARTNAATARDVACCGHASTNSDSGRSATAR
ncbi:helix-turn-helix domain-containing protein [Catenulispora sp. NF23]|uniref:GlxA family transcriptional regulator n=1 Tax=Catenulispora pinistramenti TaxID=2705254 RepID=UPI001BA906D6|nr:helix-turn-helix domain-containing protein [Catenulispora pinistramenti]